MVGRFFPPGGGAVRGLVSLSLLSFGDLLRLVTHQFFHGSGVLFCQPPGACVRVHRMGAVAVYAPLDIAGAVCFAARRLTRILMGR